MKVTKVILTVSLTAVCFLACVSIPAYAADIANSMSSSASSVKVGKSITLTCKTTYAMWGIGPVGIPFMSDWLTEVPYDYYDKPVVTSHTGSTDAAWTKANAIRVSGTVWQQKTKPSWFYGTTTWSGKYTIKATKASSSNLKFAHGQTKDILSSEGATAFTYVTVTK